MHEVKRNNRIYNYDAINLYIGVESTAFGFLLGSFLLCCFYWPKVLRLTRATPLQVILKLKGWRNFVDFFLHKWNFDESPFNLWVPTITANNHVPTVLHSWAVIIIMHHLSCELWQRIYLDVWDLASAVIAFCLLKALNEFGALRTT